jgi:hypothetical protein
VYDTPGPLLRLLVALALLKPYLKLRSERLARLFLGVGPP